MPGASYYQRKIVDYCRSVHCYVPLGFIDCKPTILLNFLPKEFCTWENLPYIRFLFHRKQQVFIIQFLTPLMSITKPLSESFKILLCRKLAIRTNMRIPECIYPFVNDFQTFTTSPSYLRRLQNLCPLYYSKREIFYFFLFFFFFSILTSLSLATPEWLFYNPNLCVSLSGLVTGASFFVDEPPPSTLNDGATLAPSPTLTSYTLHPKNPPKSYAGNRETRLDEGENIELIDEILRPLTPTAIPRIPTLIFFLSQAYDTSEKEVKDIIKASSNSRILGFIADAL
jgi:hypothetical protein